VTPKFGDARRECVPIDGVTQKVGPQCSSAERLGEHSFPPTWDAGASGSMAERSICRLTNRQSPVFTKHVGAT